MKKIKPAIVINDVDGDGTKDLSLYNEDERILTIYNLKRLGLEAFATGCAVFCALVGHSLVM